jgi:spermidine synthase
VKAGLALSALSGAIALSYEILWFRAYAFLSSGSARAFPLLLGFYLLGLAAGAAVARRFCREDGRAGAALAAFVAAANVLGFLVVPSVAWLATRGASWAATLPLVALASACLGAVFPVVCHRAVPPDARAGAGVSYLYLANIAGCTAGSLITGFVLLDQAPLRAISLLLALAGLGAAALLGRRAVGAVACALLAAGLAVAAPRLFDGLYEKLQLKTDYRPDVRFSHVVETKSGVITVDREGRVYGGGVYDGAFNTGLENDLNLIVRAYAFAGLHPAPRDVLMIGLSSGSWATVIANHPGVERLTIVEINPGYGRLLARYPAVAGLLSNPKVRIVFDDGRRWLASRKEERFDAVVANTTFHWRSHATNILSVEFLELVRSRLKPGGVYYHNTTGSDRVIRTGAEVFRHALRLYAFLALSDAPLEFDLARWKERLPSYPHGGGTVLDLSREGDRKRLDEIVAALARNLEGGESLRARTGHLEPITDDNMGTEWTEGPGR